MNAHCRLFLPKILKNLQKVGSRVSTGGEAVILWNLFWRKRDANEKFSIRPFDELNFWRFPPFLPVLLHARNVLGNVEQEPSQPQATDDAQVNVEPLEKKIKHYFHVEK